MRSNTIELQIDHHPSGRYYLKEKVGDSRVFRDCIKEENLWGIQEKNKSDFLVAVYRKIKAHLDDGWQVKLHDYPVYADENKTETDD